MMDCFFFFFFSSFFLFTKCLAASQLRAHIQYPLSVCRGHLWFQTKTLRLKMNKKRNITLLCLKATSSVSFHPQVPMQKKKITAGGRWAVAKWSSVVLSVRKQRDPLSIILATPAHWQARTYIIWCPVILLLYMCKSFALCQKGGFDNKTSPHQRGHGETESHAANKA